MSIYPIHISCLLKNVTAKCPYNSCVYNKSECPNYVVCFFNPIRWGNGDFRKILSDYPNSAIHHHENSI